VNENPSRVNAFADNGDASLSVSAAIDPDPPFASNVTVWSVEAVASTANRLAESRQTTPRIATSTRTHPNPLPPI
jgi:hypothetical protein